MPLTIGIDFDDTLFHKQPWLDEFERRSGVKVNYADIRNWDFSPAVPKNLYPLLHECRTPDIYEEMPPMPGATLGVRHLLNAGHRLIVVTHDNPSHISAKRRALERRFPELDTMVVAQDKWAAIPGMNLLVDDGLHNRPTILFDQPWNQEATLYPGQARAANWEAVERLVFYHSIVHQNNTIC